MNWRAKAMSVFLLGLVRLLTGAQARWYGCPPKAEQRIYFANHQSHADLVLIWAALPEELRSITRPIAAKDYWTASNFKRWITTEVFNAVYVERERKGDEDPLQPLIDGGDGDSVPRRHARPCRGPAAVQERPVQPCAAFSGRGAGAGLDPQRAARHAQRRGGAGAGAVFGHVRRAGEARR
jgi:1-acyl-sn-glycerol-3-phosphate acyltransferase